MGCERVDGATVEEVTGGGGGVSTGRRRRVGIRPVPAGFVVRGKDLKVN